MKKVFCFCLLILIMCPIFSDVPQLIPFQGKVNDSEGTPLNGLATVTFNLYSDFNGNVLQWSETLDVNFDEGLFSVLLGQITPLDLELVQDNELWLGIEVDGDSEMTPLIKLGASPYALTDGDWLVFPEGLATGENINIGGGDFDYPLQVNADVDGDGELFGDAVAKFFNNHSSNAAAVYCESGDADEGIGAYVKGGWRALVAEHYLGNKAYLGTVDYAAHFFGDTRIDNEIEIYGSNLHVSSDGKVGIATDNPQYPLHVIRDYDNTCELSSAALYVFNSADNCGGTGIYSECFSNNDFSLGGYFKGYTHGIYAEVNSDTDHSNPSGVISIVDCSDGGINYSFNGQAINGNSNYGIECFASGGNYNHGGYLYSYGSGNCYGLIAEAYGSGENVALTATAWSGTSNLAAHFLDGNVAIDNNLGIGTSEPTKDLTIYNNSGPVDILMDSNVEDAQIGLDGVNGESGIKILENGIVKSGLLYDHSENSFKFENDGNYMSIDDDSFIFRSSFTDDDLVFHDYPGNNMQCKLKSSVANSTLILDAGLYWNSSLKFNEDGSDKVSLIYNGFDDYFAINDGEEIFTVKDHKIGIGTNDPQKQVHLYDMNSCEIRIESDNSCSLSLDATNSAEIEFYDRDGTVQTQIDFSPAMDKFSLSNFDTSICMGTDQMGFNTFFPDQDFHFYKDNGNLTTKFEATSGQVTMILDSSSGSPNYSFYDNGTFAASVGYDIGNDNLYFYQGGPCLKAKNGDVGISGDWNSSYALYVHGSAYCTGSWQGSDKRYKKNINSLSGNLEKIKTLNGVSYNWRRDEFPEENLPDGEHFGLIAQEVEEVLPQIVMTDDEGYKSVAYTELIPILIEAVKEQQEIIERQQNEIDEIRKELSLSR